jgi:hypothetical protein
MEGNKLKHNFVEKNDYLERLRAILRQDWENVVITKEISNDLIENNIGIDFIDITKKEMLREMMEHIYNNNLMRIIEIDDPLTRTKTIKMEIKLNKI